MSCILTHLCQPQPVVFGVNQSDDDEEVPNEAEDEATARAKSMLPSPAPYVYAHPTWLYCVDDLTGCRLTMFLSTENDSQCRFAVKNEGKALNTVCSPSPHITET
jgi:hypothetical protein